jgi:uncharacterized protein YjiS (DUF1127 family)
MELEEAMRKLRDAGLSARDAQRAAQALLGASRAEAYEAAHRPSANASAAQEPSP